jgi:hypothetical protein
MASGIRHVETNDEAVDLPASNARCLPVKFGTPDRFPSTLRAGSIAEKACRMASEPLQFSIDSRIRLRMPSPCSFSAGLPPALSWPAFAGNRAANHSMTVFCSCGTMKVRVFVGRQGFLLP